MNQSVLVFRRDFKKLLDVHLLAYRGARAIAQGERIYKGQIQPTLLSYSSPETKAESKN
ncbi:hypothetical protein KaCgl_17720 [Corynebacterium glutamicum]|nr:hypothetical protein KaCgl_17720 [Corynebacterium glutamicum]